MEKIGFTKKEARIYLALVELGPSSVSAIARQTGMHRPTIYQTLPNLIDKKLVSLAPREKQKRYAAESPEKLKIIFNELSLRFQELLPELQTIHQSQNKKPLVKFLEGRKGIMFVFEDIITALKRGEVFYRYSSRSDMVKSEYYLPPHYREDRDRKQLERLVITNEWVSKQKAPRLEREIKVVPPDYDLFAYNITQLIYGKKVAFIDYNTETALIIENPVIAEFHRKIFKLLYSKL